MAVARHNVNLTSAELRWMASTIAGREPQGEGRIQFEADLQDYLGVRHVRAVDSGRVALHLALAGLGIGSGHRVVLPRYCFFSLAHVLEGLGIEAVWAPVNPETLALDPDHLEKYLDNVRAVVLIHPFGQVGPVRELRACCDARGVPLIEDGSQATGGGLGDSKVGTLGRVGVFSLVSGKNLQTFGGGFLSSDDDALIARVDALLRDAAPLPEERTRSALRQGVLRWFLTTPLGYSGLMHPLTLGIQALAPAKLEALFHEERSSYDSERVLYRLSDAQGHLGCMELRELDRRNQIRRGHALRLIDGLQGLPGLKLPRMDPAADNTFNALAVRVGSAETLQLALRKRGVDTRSDYMSWYGPTRDFSENVLYLPNHPGMTQKDIDHVVRAVREQLR